MHVEMKNEVNELEKEMEVEREPVNEKQLEEKTQVVQSNWFVEAERVVDQELLLS
jgi:hypothetical protein